MQFATDILKKCWFLAGPTGCGKTETAIRLAERIDAEIVSLDSMALYRGMDIGTAKPSTEAQQAVPHHLVDVLDPHEEFSVAEYAEAAATVCRGIVDRQRIPLFVGGTGLYLRGTLRGVFEGPAADWEFRRSQEAEAARQEPGYLHAQLREVDPEAADVLHANDTRRLIRALEVYRTTGVPLSNQQQQPALPPGERPPHVYWLLPPRDWLYERINRRVEQMFAAGLVEEVKRLLAGRRSISHTARQALGYKEVIAHLEGECSIEEAVELIQRRTRRFAKQQHTWFRNLEECRAIEITGREAPEELAVLIVETAARQPDA